MKNILKIFKWNHKSIMKWDNYICKTFSVIPCHIHGKYLILANNQLITLLNFMCILCSTVAFILKMV